MGYTLWLLSQPPSTACFEWNEVEQPNIEFSCPAERSLVPKVPRMYLTLLDIFLGVNCNDLLGSISSSALFKDSGPVLQVLNHECKKPM
jgi:hypothetical protein